MATMTIANETFNGFQPGVIDGPGDSQVKDFTTIADKSVFLKTRFSVLGNTRKVSGSQVLDADKVDDNASSWVKVTKNLLDSPELAEIKRQDMNTRKWLENVCLPWDIGVAILPIGLIETVHSKLEAYKLERAELVNAFVSAYPGLLSNAAQHLGHLYNPNDYLSAEDVRSKFAFSWDYVAFGVPGQLKDISPALFQAQKEKAAQQLEDAASEITLLMRQTLHEMVAHLADKLAPGDEGKPKILRSSAVENLKEFLSTFDFRNITNDTQLAEQVDKARALLDGVNVESLRKSDNWRSTIQSGMQKISDNLSFMIEEKAGRKFRLDD